MERYRIARKFGKGIVDMSGKQVAWVDDYVLAKRVCMFLNRDEVLYPEYAKIGGDCYRLDGDDYYCDKTGVRVEFTVDGSRLLSVSGIGGMDGLEVVECSRGDWYGFNYK